MEEPDGLPSMGSQRVRHDLVTNTFIRGKADLFQVCVALFLTPIYGIKVIKGGQILFCLCKPQFGLDLQ